ncbi:MAG TPA: hypothetical protein VIH35_06330, partial [Kiritimatiellia bacterium]
MHKLFLALSLLSLSSLPSLSLELHRGETYDLAPEQAASGQVVILAGTASLRGSSEDDVFVCANDVSVTGELRNDAWVFANA